MTKTREIIGGCAVCDLPAKVTFSGRMPHWPSDRLTWLCERCAFAFADLFVAAGAECSITGIMGGAA